MENAGCARGAPAAARAARELVAGFCARTQAMSPDDVAALTALVAVYSGASAAKLPPAGRPVLAALHRDLELADGSTVYALFRERAGVTIAASALIAAPTPE